MREFLDLVSLSDELECLSVPGDGGWLITAVTDRGLYLQWPSATSAWSVFGLLLQHRENWNAKGRVYEVHLSFRPNTSDQSHINVKTTTHSSSTSTFPYQTQCLTPRPAQSQSIRLNHQRVQRSTLVPKSGELISRTSLVSPSSFNFGSLY
jgi:hypothetical protein